MKLNIKEILLILFVLILSAFSLLNLEKIRKGQESIDLFQNNINSNEMLLNALKKNTMAQIETEGTIVNSKVILQNGLNETINYERMITGKTLVIRIYSSGCSICLEDELTKIKAFLQINKISSVVYLMSHVRNYREFLSFSNNNHLPLEKCYFLKDRNALNIPLELKNPYIYLYVTDSSYSVQKTFVPITNFDQLTNLYFTYVKDLLSNKMNKTSLNRVIFFFNIPILTIFSLGKRCIKC